MKRLGVLLLLFLAGPAYAQANGWTDLANGWGEIQTATGGSTVPVGCVAGSVALFLGSPVAAGCDAGITYDAATDTLTVVGAVNGAAFSTGGGALLSGSALSFADANPSTAVIRWLGSSGYKTGLTQAADGLLKVTNGSTGDGAISAQGFKYVTGTRPTCDASARGMTWYVAGGAGVADTIEICGKAAADTYSWVALATF